MRYTWPETGPPAQPWGTGLRRRLNCAPAGPAERLPTEPQIVWSNRMPAHMSNRIRRLRNGLRHARQELDRYSKLLLAIQRSIVPQQLPGVPGLDLAVYFTAANGVGG